VIKDVKSSVALEICRTLVAGCYSFTDAASQVWM